MPLRLQLRTGRCMGRRRDGKPNPICNASATRGTPNARPVLPQSLDGHAHAKPDDQQIAADGRPLLKPSGEMLPGE